MTGHSDAPVVLLRGSRLTLLAELGAAELLAGRAVRLSPEPADFSRARAVTIEAVRRRASVEAVPALLARLAVGEPDRSRPERYLRSWWLPIEAELSEGRWADDAGPLHLVDPRPACRAVELGPPAPGSGGARYRLALLADERAAALPLVIGAVHEVVTELRGRGVRLPMSMPRQLAAGLPLIRTADAADALVGLADQRGGGNRQVLAAAVTSGELLWRLLAAGLRLPTAGGPHSAEAAPVTGLLERRLAPLLAQPTAADYVMADCAPVDQVACTPPSEVELAALIEEIRTERQRLRRQRDHTAATLGRLRAPATAGGLPYLAVGRDNPAVVVVNALGQRLAPWLPLVAEREPGRTLVWQPAGGHRLGEQVADLTEVLAVEGIDRCCLLAWCSGAKVATRFWRQQPRRVSALMLLAADFRDRQRPAALDSPYEQNLDKISDKLAQHPQLADWIVGMFDQQIAASGDDVLFGPPLALLSEIRKPFGSAAALLEYAGQLRDFWAADELTTVDRIDCPVLSVIGGRDTIVAPATAAAAAARFRTARHLELPDATHYVMYERPELLATVLAEFFDEAVLNSLDLSVAD